MCTYERLLSRKVQLKEYSYHVTNIARIANKCTVYSQTFCITYISVEIIHIPGVTLVYGYSLLRSGMQVIEVLPHETSRHTDENSTNQALHSNTSYYCKSKVQVLSRYESQRTSSRRTPCVKVTVWRTDAAGFISGLCSLEEDNRTATINF